MRFSYVFYGRATAIRDSGKEESSCAPDDVTTRVTQQENRPSVSVPKQGESHRTFPSSRGRGAWQAVRKYGGSAGSRPIPAQGARRVWQAAPAEVEAAKAFIF